MDILKRFKILDCKTSSTLMNVNELLKVEDNTGKANAKRFWRWIKLSIAYQNDVTHSVNVIFRLMRNPSIHHLGAAK